MDMLGIGISNFGFVFNGYYVYHRWGNEVYLNNFELGDSRKLVFNVNIVSLEQVDGFIVIQTDNLFAYSIEKDVVFEIEEIIGKVIPKKVSVFSSLVNVVKSTVKHIVSGLEKVSPKLQEERLKICEGCPLYDNGTCKKCGCVLSIKTSWASEQCPLDPPKWEKYEQEKGGCGCGG